MSSSVSIANLFLILYCGSLFSSPFGFFLLPNRLRKTWTAHNVNTNKYVHKIGHKKRWKRGETKMIDIDTVAWIARMDCIYIGTWLQLNRFDSSSSYSSSFSSRIFCNRSMETLHNFSFINNYHRPMDDVHDSYFYVWLFIYFYQHLLIWFFLTIFFSRPVLFA